MHSLGAGRAIAHKKYAWGYDELTPTDGGHKNTFGGYAASLVDALDALWIMDLKPDFCTAVGMVSQMDLMNTTETGLNLFETTIRHLGGLLGAYDLSNEPVLLRKAVELGDMLLAAFYTPNRLPGSWLNFDDAKKRPADWRDERPVSHRYYDAIHRVTKFLERSQNSSQLPGLWPVTINFRDERVNSSDRFTLGALSDSLYEYLPKMHILLGGLGSTYERLYRRAAERIQEHMLFRPMLPAGIITQQEEQDILFSGNVVVDSHGQPQLDPESDHLACFAGGMFGVASTVFNDPKQVDVGERLARGCAWVYSSMPTGVGPEIFGLIPCLPNQNDSCIWDEQRWETEGVHNLNIQGFKHAREPKYILRPEALESLFLMYRITGKQEYRDIAWGMFQAILRATETEYAFSAIRDVTARGETEKLNSMESFWFSETLRYAYLIFSSPGVISLDEYVFISEAHPLKRPLPTGRWIRTGSWGI